MITVNPLEAENMALARCPECDELIEITPTGQVIKSGFSAQRWRVDMHAAPKTGRLAGTVCEGSGKLV